MGVIVEVMRCPVYMRHVVEPFQAGWKSRFHLSEEMWCWSGAKWTNNKILNHLREWDSWHYSNPYKIYWNIHLRCLFFNMYSYIMRGISDSKVTNKSRNALFKGFWIYECVRTFDAHCQSSTALWCSLFCFAFSLRLALTSLCFYKIKNIWVQLAILPW